MMWIEHTEIGRTGGQVPPNIWTGGHYHKCPPPNIQHSVFGNGPF